MALLASEARGAKLTGRVLVMYLFVSLVLAPDAFASEPTRLTLEEVIVRAQRSGRSQAAEQTRLEANARLAEAQAAAYPKAFATSFVGPSPRIECADADCTRTTPENVALDLSGVFGGVQLTIVQPLYTFGRISTATSAAGKAAAAAGFLSDALAGDIAVQCARAYFGLKLARELVWMLEDGSAQIADALQNIRDSLAQGTGEVTIQDRLRVETLAAEVQVRLAEAREAEYTALAAVRALVDDSNADTDSAVLEPVTIPLAKGVSSYVERARADRPEVKAAGVGLAGARDYVDFRRADYWPHLLLVAGLKFARAQGTDDPPTAFANDPFNETSAQLGLTLRWTVDPMTQMARVDQARAQARRLAALRTAALSAVEFDARRAFIQIEQAGKRLKATESGEKSARGWLASVLQANAIGTAEPKDLADAYIAFFTIRGRRLQAMHDWNVAAIALRRAVGEFPANSGRPSRQAR